MTEKRAPRARASRRELRAWAWVAGGLALLVPWAVVAEAQQASATKDKRPVVVVRRITRRVIITQPAKPSGVQYVYTSAPSSSSSSSSSSSGGGAPAPTSTGGS